MVKRRLVKTKSDGGDRQPSCGASGCSGYVYLMIRLLVQKQYLQSLLDTDQPQRNSSGLHYSVWIFPHLPRMPSALFRLQIPSSTHCTAVFGWQTRQSCCWFGKWMATNVCLCWVWRKTSQSWESNIIKDITGGKNKGRCYSEERLSTSQMSQCEFCEPGNLQRTLF